MVSVNVTSQIKIELEQLLNGVAQLETADLEKFVAEVNVLLAQRKVASLPQPEVQLLKQINQGLPEASQRRYNELRAKRQAKALTPDEHEELVSLIDTVEQADAERLQHLLDLSQLRQVPLSHLMHQLDIAPPSVYV